MQDYYIYFRQGLQDVRKVWSLANRYGFICADGGSEFFVFGHDSEKFGILMEKLRGLNLGIEVIIDTCIDGKWCSETTFI